MRIREFIEPNSKGKFLDMFEKFLPLAMHYLELKSLPKMKFQAGIHDTDQPTFGKYENGLNELHVALTNRHPVDILRTVAHELAHYKQDLENRLKPNSGETGSDEENEAHALAGIVMRHFNKKYPEFLEDKPVVSESITTTNTEAKYQGNIGIMELIKFFSKHPELKPKYNEIKSQEGAIAAFNWALKQMGIELEGEPYKVAENFADGRNPQDKGDSARHGIRKGMTIAQLKKIRSSKTASPRKRQLAHWQINMRQGRKK